MGKASNIAQMANAPVFNATKTSSQTFATAAASKVIFNNEVVDTANCYNPATARFTPNVPGYYQINAAVTTAAGAAGICLVSIYLNNVESKRGTQVSMTSPNLVFTMTVSGLIYMNGTTDFVEIFAYFSAAGVTADTAGISYFDGTLVRAA